MVNKISKKMKRILVIAGLFFAVITASAQGTLDEGRLQLNAGLGFSTWGVPIHVGLDYGVAQDFTIGGKVSFSSYTQNLVGYKYTHTIIGIIADGNYHFNRILELPSEFDLYAGLSLGYYNFSTSGEYAYSGNLASGMGFYAQIGGRYFFDDAWGINLELGGGTLSGGTIGVTYKF